MDTNESRRRSLGLLRDAALTVTAVLFAYAAFDDITTDSAKTFAVEYSGLVVCAVWVLTLAIRLIRIRRPVLGGISLMALAAAVWGQRAIGPGVVPAPWSAHSIAVVAAFAWFALLSVLLVAIGWRAPPD